MPIILEGEFTPEEDSKLHEIVLALALEGIEVISARIRTVEITVYTDRKLTPKTYRLIRWNGQGITSPALKRIGAIGKATQWFGDIEI